MVMNKKRLKKIVIKNKRLKKIIMNKKRFKKILIKGKDSKNSHKRERFSQMIINKNK